MIFNIECVMFVYELIKMVGNGVSGVSKLVVKSL